MSSVQEIGTVETPLPSLLLKILNSTSAQDRMVGILILMQRCHPLRFQVACNGERMPAAKLTELLRAAIDTAKASPTVTPLALARDQRYKFGLKLISDCPRKLSIGQGFNINLSLIDRQGEAQNAKVTARCRLSVVGGHCKNNEESAKRKRSRVEEAIICGETEVDVDAEQGVVFSSVYFSQSSRYTPHGSFTLRVHCLTLDCVKPLELPPIRVY